MLAQLKPRESDKDRLLVELITGYTGQDAGDGPYGYGIQAEPDAELADQNSTTNLL